MKTLHAYYILMPFAIVSMLWASCSRMYDNLEGYVDGETVYADKFDGIERIQIGYERVEIDLMRAGRIPASQIRMGKAKKTVIECPDFEEENHRRVFDSICSWVNITGLTQLKSYRFTIYTEDEHGNRSLPLEAEARPFTKENLDALPLPYPTVIESSSAALLEWRESISSNMCQVFNYGFEYADMDGDIHTGGDVGDLPSFFVENVEQGADIPVHMKFFVIPTTTDAVGTFTPILDTIYWEPQVILRISESASPAIFLKTPEAAFSIDVYNTSTVFPLVFSWVNVFGIDNYTLKISADPAFPDDPGKTTAINVGSANEYEMSETEGLSNINMHPRQRSVELYWTVEPTTAAGVTTQTRSILATRSPILLGQWTFDNPADPYHATLGEDLVPSGGGFTPVDGMSASDKAIRISKGSYFTCLHGLPVGSDNYTLMVKVKLPVKEYHALLQTDPANTDAAEFVINADGLPGMDGIGVSLNHFTLGPKHWHQLFLVSSGNTFNVYANGILAYTGTNSNARYKLNAAEMLLFASGANNDNEIEVSEVALWDLALEESELWLYDNLKQVSRSDLSVAGYSDSDPNSGPVANVIDGNLWSTPWSNIEPNSWLVLDMSKQRKIGRIMFASHVWLGAGPKTIQFSVGDAPNASSWTLLGTIVRNGQTYNNFGALFMLDLPQNNRTGRYLRVDLPDMYGPKSHITEISVFEKTQ